MDPLRAAAAERHPLSEPLSEPSSPVEAPRVTPLPADLRGVPLLYALACRGRWGEVAAAAARQLGDPGTASEAVLPCVTLHALALAKQRLYNAADDLLQSPTLLAAVRDTVAARGEEAVPFALRLLRCELPQHLGRPADTRDALSLLHDACLRHAAEPAVGDEAARVWRSRAWRVVCRLVAFHHALGDLRSALAWLDLHTRRCPDDQQHLRLARQAAAALCLQAGDATAAQLAGVGERDLGAKVLLASKDFAVARRQFDDARRAAPGDLCASNNAAVAALYCGDLPGATAAMESARPTGQGLHEAIIMNMCILSDLSAADPAAAKAQLAALVSTASDDFNSVAAMGG